MVHIDCKLFGTLAVYENGNKVIIPPGKVSALFCYMLHKKIVSRDELASIFWPDTNEEKAKTSLRNALHKIRKSFQTNIILSPNKYILALNDQFIYHIDTEIFDKDPIHHLDLYIGEFLKNIYIKDLIEFEYWLTVIREHFQKKYINTLQQKIIYDFETKQMQELEKNINLLLNMDNYNDTAHIYLMKYYQLNGRNDKIINEYYNVQKMFLKDLGIDPPDEVKKLYEAAIHQINKKNKRSELKETEIFYNRDFELKILQKNLDYFYQNMVCKSIIIEGEPGIGKTVLKKQLFKLNDGKFKIFEVNCYSIEKNFFYSPWIKMINLLNKEFSKHIESKPSTWDHIANRLFFYGSNDPKAMNILENKEKYNPNLIYNAIFEALEALSLHHKIVVVLEDIQWADEMSIELFVNLILHLGGKICFIATKSNEIDENLNRQITELKDLKKMMVVKIKRFNKIEVGNVLRRLVKNRKITQEDIDNIYEKSKGNAFFLKEYIDLFKKNISEEKLMTSRMYDVIQEKFFDLSEDEMTMLAIISAFYANVDVDMLVKIVDIVAFDVIKYLNLFVRKDILEEIKKDDKIYVHFTHFVYKNYIYNELADSAKKIINKEIADALETELINDNKDITNYVKLKYHYTRANEAVKVLKYEVYILNYYLNFNHEMFPNLNDYDLSKQVKMNISNEKAICWMKEIEKKILKIKNINRTHSKIYEMKEAELQFLYSKGRYFIRCGNYSTGKQVMNKVIKLSKEQGNIKTQISGHKQMVIYGIQTNDSDLMLSHILKGLYVAKNLQTKSETAVFYRLYGVYCMMKGEFKKAEKLFYQSISIFKNEEIVMNSHSICIAANYNYIGEIRNAEEKYNKAMKFYQQAISLCQDTNITCLSLFFINAAKTSYLMNDLESMILYLQKANLIVKEFDSYWKNSVLKALLALHCFTNHEYIETLHYLHDAVTEVKTINNSRDIGMVYFVQTIILHTLNRQNINCEKLVDFFEQPLEFYYETSLKHLDRLIDIAEINLLKKLLFQ